jgi:flagellar hook assembly protein FlgD
VGDNSFRAAQVLDSTSVSPKSNTVIVHFDTAAGFFMPVPMVPGASFDLNTVDAAAKVELRIFDTVGDLVIRFQNREPRTTYSFVWDGKNGSGQSVRRGPLVAVAAVDYPDGTHEIVRQVFLFDPKGSP